MVTISRRTGLKTGAAALAMATAGRAGDVLAQEPLESVRIIVGFPPGGTSDIAARWIADKLPKSYARSVIIDNRPGAAGRIGVDVLKGSPADGRSMILQPYSITALYPHVYRQLSYDPVADLLPVSGASEFVHGLGVGSLVPASVTDLKGFAAWAKANPALANCGNPGEGSLPHFLTMLMAQGLDAPVQAIPYRGGAPAFVDALGGRLAGIMLPEGSFFSMLADGRMRILATSGKTRSHFTPNVATFAEQGLTKIVVREWFGLFMHGKTDPAHASRAAAAIRVALADKDLTETFAKNGMLPMPTTPEELARMNRAETEFWGAAVKGTGFKPIE